MSDEVLLEPRRILVVDDDEHLRERLARSLRSRSHQVWTASDTDSALALAAEQAFDVALLDLKMPGESGLVLLKGLKERFPELHAIILTGYGSVSTAIEATKLGATDFLQKPVSTEEVLAAISGEREAARPTYVETPSLANAEWEHIQRVLGDCDGNITEAAKRLEIDRRSLQRKLKKYAPRR